MNNTKKGSTRMAVLVVLLIFILISATALAQRRSGRDDSGFQAQGQEKVGIAGQFLGSVVCIFSGCGWPAIILFILPAVAVFFYKKYISLG